MKFLTPTQIHQLDEIEQSYFACAKLKREEFEKYFLEVAYDNGLTRATTIVFNGPSYLICYEGEFAYEIHYPTELFKKDLKDRNLLSKERCHEYKIILDDPYYNYGS